MRSIDDGEHLGLDQSLSKLGSAAHLLLATSPVLLGEADPPRGPGVYILSVGGDITYVGEAKGRKGLRDRLLSKHISGDEGHAIQRAFADEFPDRLLRREHIKRTVQARWIQVDDPLLVSTLERFLIWRLQPKWNVR